MDANAYKDLGRSKLDAFKAKRAAVKAVAGSTETQACINVVESVATDIPTPVDQAVVDLKHSNELLQAQIYDLQAQNMTLQEKCSAAEKGKQEAEERSARAAREAAEQLLLVESRVRSLQVEIDQVRQSEVSKWEDQALSLEASLQEKDKLLEDLSAEAKVLEERYQRLHDRHEIAHVEFNRLKQVSTERKARITELEKSQEDFASKTSDQEAKVSSLQQELLEASSQLESVCDKLSSITDQRDALREAVQELQAESQEHALQISSLQSLVNKLQETAASNQDHSTVADELRSQVTQLLNELTEVKSSLASEIEKGASRLSESEQKVTDLHSKLARAKVQFDKAKASSAEYKDQAAKLKEEVDVLTELKSQYEHQLEDLSTRSSISVQELSNVRSMYEQASNEAHSYQSQLSESNDLAASLEVELSSTKALVLSLELRLDQVMVESAREWEEKVKHAKSVADEEWSSRAEAMLQEAELAWSSKLSMANDALEALESQLKETQGQAEEAESKSKAARDRLATGKTKFMKVQSSLQEKTDELSSLQQHFKDFRDAAEAKILSLEVFVSELEQASKSKELSCTTDSSTDPLAPLSRDMATDPSVPSHADSGSDAVSPLMASVSTLTLEDMIPRSLYDEAEERHAREMTSYAHNSEIRLDALVKELSDLRDAYSNVSQCLTQFQVQAQALIDQDEASSHLLNEMRADLEKAQIDKEELARHLEDLEEARAAAASTALLEADRAKALESKLMQLRDLNPQVDELQHLLQDAEAAKQDALLRCNELQRLLEDAEAAKQDAFLRSEGLQHSLEDADAAKRDALLRSEGLQHSLEDADAAKQDALLRSEGLQHSLEDADAAKQDALLRCNELQRLLEDADAAKQDALLRCEELQGSFQQKEEVVSSLELRLEDLSSLLIESDARVEELQEKLGECLASLYSFENK